MKKTMIIGLVLLITLSSCANNQKQQGNETDTNNKVDELVGIVPDAENDESSVDKSDNNDSSKDGSIGDSKNNTDKKEEVVGTPSNPKAPSRGPEDKAKVTYGEIELIDSTIPFKVLDVKLDPNKPHHDEIIPLYSGFFCFN